MPFVVAQSENEAESAGMKEEENAMLKKRGDERGEMAETERSRWERGNSMSGSMLSTRSQKREEGRI